MNLLTGMTLLFLAVSQTEGEEDTIFLIWEGQAALVSALNFACCTIFATTATGNVIIRDYGKEKASLLFSYPVPKKDLSGQMSVGRCVDFASRNYRNWSTAWSVVCSVMGNRDSASDDFRQILDGGTCSRNERSICGGSHVYLQQNNK